MIHKLRIHRIESAEVLVDLPRGMDPADADKELIAASMSFAWIADDWTSDLEIDGHELATDEEIEECYVMNGRPTTLKAKLAARSEEIGVGPMTLRNWQKLGVDIWDDDDCRRHIASQKRTNMALKPAFQLRLSQ